MVAFLYSKVDEKKTKYNLNRKHIINYFIEKDHCGVVSIVIEVFGKFPNEFRNFLFYFITFKTTDGITIIIKKKKKVKQYHAYNTAMMIIIIIVTE